MGPGNLEAQGRGTFEIILAIANVSFVIIRGDGACGPTSDIDLFTNPIRRIGGNRRQRCEIPNENAYRVDRVVLIAHLQTDLSAILGPDEAT